MPSTHFMSGGNIPFNDRVSCWILTQRDCYQNFNFVSRPNNFCTGLTGSFQNFIGGNVKYCWGNKSLVRNFSFCGFLHNIGAVVTSIKRPHFMSILFYSFCGKANNANGAKFPLFLSCHLNFDQNGLLPKFQLCVVTKLFLYCSYWLFSKLHCRNENYWEGK